MHSNVTTWQPRKALPKQQLKKKLDDLQTQQQNLEFTVNNSLSPERYLSEVERHEKEVEDALQALDKFNQTPASPSSEEIDITPQTPKDGRKRPPFAPSPNASDIDELVQYDRDLAEIEYVEEYGTCWGQKHEEIPPDEYISSDSEDSISESEMQKDAKELALEQGKPQTFTHPEAIKFLHQNRYTQKFSFGGIGADKQFTDLSEEQKQPIQVKQPQATSKAHKKPQIGPEELRKAQVDLDIMTKERKEKMERHSQEMYMTGFGMTLSTWVKNLHELIDKHGNSFEVIIDEMFRSVKDVKRVEEYWLSAVTEFSVNEAYIDFNQFDLNLPPYMIFRGSFNYCFKTHYHPDTTNKALWLSGSMFMTQEGILVYGVPSNHESMACGYYLRNIIKAQVFRAYANSRKLSLEEFIFLMQHLTEPFSNNRKYQQARYSACTVCNGRKYRVNQFQRFGSNFIFDINVRIPADPLSPFVTVDCKCSPLGDLTEDDTILFYNSDWMNISTILGDTMQGAGSATDAYMMVLMAHPQFTDRLRQLYHHYSRDAVYRNLRPHVNCGLWRPNAAVFNHLREFYGQTYRQRFQDFYDRWYSMEPRRTSLSHESIAWFYSIVINLTTVMGGLLANMLLSIVVAYPIPFWISVPIVLLPLSIVGWIRGIRARLHFRENVNSSNYMKLAFVSSFLIACWGFSRIIAWRRDSKKYHKKRLDKRSRNEAWNDIKSKDIGGGIEILYGMFEMVIGSLSLAGVRFSAKTFNYFIKPMLMSFNGALRVHKGFTKVVGNEGNKKKEEEVTPDSAKEQTAEILNVHDSEQQAEDIMEFARVNNFIEEDPLEESEQHIDDEGIVVVNTEPANVRRHLRDYAWQYSIIFFIATGLLVYIMYRFISKDKKKRKRNESGRVCNCGQTIEEDQSYCPKCGDPHTITQKLEDTVAKIKEKGKATVQDVHDVIAHIENESGAKEARALFGGKDRNNNNDDNDRSVMRRQHKEMSDYAMDRQQDALQLHTSLTRIKQLIHDNYGDDIEWVEKNRKIVATTRQNTEGLFNYEYFTVRVGRFEAQVRTRNHAEVMDLMQELQKLHRQGQGMMVNAGGVWRTLTFEGNNNQAAKLTRAQAEKMLAKMESAHQMSFSRTEKDKIKKSPDPNDTVQSIIAHKLIKGEAKILGHTPARPAIVANRNEGLLGGRVISIETYKQSIKLIYNPETNDHGHGFFMDGNLVTARHVVSSIDNTKPIVDTIFVGDVEIKTEGVVDSISGDYAVIPYNNQKPPSLIPMRVPNGYYNYEGPGYILSLSGDMQKPETLVMKMSIGQVIKYGARFYHMIPTTPGMSGAPIFNIDGKIIGLHKGFAGISNIGRCIEDVINRKQDCTFQVGVEYDESGVFENHGAGADLNVNLTYLPSELAPKVWDLDISTEWDDNPNCDIVGMTLYKKSEYDKLKFSEYYLENHESFDLPNPPYEEFSIATPTLETIKKDFAKYIRPLNYKIDEDVWNRTLTIFQQFLDFILPDKYGMMSIAEAIQDMDLKKAAGVFLKKKYYSKGDFLKSDTGLMSVITFIDMIDHGDFPDAPFDIVGKEELRPTQKILDEKIRSINSSMTHEVIAEKMMLQHLLDEISLQPFFKTGCTVGWSPYYGGWHELVCYLTEDCIETYSTMDFVKWDSTILARILITVVSELLKRVRTKDHPNMPKWYIARILGQKVCVVPYMNYEDYCIQTGRPVPKNAKDYWVALIIVIYRGMASGQLITLHVNCLVNHFRHIYCLLGYGKHVYERFDQGDMTPKNGEKGELSEIVSLYLYPTYNSFQQLTRPLACGDDFAFGMLKVRLSPSKYAEISAQLAFELESIVPIEGDLNKIDFAGLKNWHCGHYNIFVIDRHRLLVNLSVIKRGMTMDQYAQKLDNLVRHCAMCEPDIAKQIIEFRDYLAAKWENATMVIVRQGFATFEEACLMQFPILEVESVSTASPHKNQSASNDFYNLENVRTAFHYHGNYCGPGYSAGAYQSSTNDPTVPSVDEFDETCRVHDASYANGEDLAEADLRFAYNNINTNPFRLAAGLVVGAQGLLRKAGILERKITQLDEMPKARRKSNTRSIRKQVGRLKKEARHIRAAVRNVPRGKKMRRNPRKVGRRNRRNGGSSYPLVRSSRPFRPHFKVGPNSMRGAVISGKDYLTAITSGSFGISAETILYSLRIEPGSIPGRLATFAQCYEKYKFKSFRIHYKPTCPTTTEGGLIACYDIDPEDDFTPGENLKREMMSTDRSREWRVFDSQVLPMRTKLKGDVYRYIDVTLDDPRWEQQAKFVLATTTDIAANVQVAQIWCSYVIEFQGAHFQVGSTGGDGMTSKVTMAGTTSLLAPFGDAAIVDSNSTITTDCSIDEAGKNLFIFGQTPVGRYMCIMRLNGSSITQGIAVTPTACTVTAYTPQIVNSSYAIYSFFVDYNGGNTDFALEITSLGGSPVYSSGSFYMVKLATGVTKKKRVAKQIDAEVDDLLEDEVFMKKLRDKLLKLPLDDRDNNNPKIRDPCKFCGDVEPDHDGRNCPMKPETGSKTPPAFSRAPLKRQ